MQWILAYLTAFLDVWLEAAPWLLVGLVAAGLIHVFIPANRMAGWLGGSGLWASFKAAVIGTPLPLCSCSVLPAALAIRKQGASKPSTVSFLVATPENGADSIALTWALLGPWFAIARPIAAIISAVVAGTLTAILTRDQEISDQNTTLNDAQTPSGTLTTCCSNQAEHNKAQDLPQGDTGKVSLLTKLKSALVFGFDPMLGDIAKWLMIGLLLAALMNTLIDPGTFAAHGSGPLAYAVMITIGIPMYICATASTPIAASLLLAGVSPGAVMIFLLAGPATNIGSIAVIRKALGSRALIAYLLGVAIVAITAAFIIDATNWFAIDLSNKRSAAHEHPHASLISIAAGIVLALAMFYRLLFHFGLTNRRATKTN